MHRIMVVDDEPSILEFFQILLAESSLEVQTFGDSTVAIEALQERGFDLVLTDLSMPKKTGMDVLQAVKEKSPQTLVVLITAYGTTESAVAAMKAGAYDYIMKPFKIDEIRVTIRNAIETIALRRENDALRAMCRIDNNEIPGFLGNSASMRKIYEMIRRVAPTRSSVLIVGESGTGKELAAKALHALSPRREFEFVSINCGAIPENLLESELFGYCRGAFSGADGDKMGLFEVADQGTLFLDEIGELPLSMQVKLLRVLQERSLRRLGSTATHEVDVRIVAATNRNLEEDVADGRFREDLFFRLNVIQMIMPPLRERREDIPMLVQSFLNRAAHEAGKSVRTIEGQALQQLMHYGFRGNVRELENIIEQGVALEETDCIRWLTLPEKVRLNGHRLDNTVMSFPESGIDLDQVMASYEKALILDALRLSKGVRKKAADLLKISFRSIRYRLDKLGLE